MKVLVTGADGFIGRNLIVRLGENGTFDVLPVTRDTTDQNVSAFIEVADAVIHLAGVNRPQDPSEFEAGNARFTKILSDRLSASGRVIPLAFTSSIQALVDNAYGSSKREAEKILEQHAISTGASVAVYRLPNVFGKWCRPNYNSAVATFCHNIARGLDVQIHGESTPLKLVYIDDVVEELVRFLKKPGSGYHLREVTPVFVTTVGEVVEQIRAFARVRDVLVSERVGAGLVRALYSTYVSYLEPADFSYAVPKYTDERGVFVEMMKTQDSGQFSFFTAHPGITRGGHYHHSKSEKFLVIRGYARFKFRNILTGDLYSIDTDGENPVIVDTIPGWAHEVTNIGDSELVVMLWANENFDRERPDTIASKV